MTCSTCLQNKIAKQLFKTLIVKKKKFTDRFLLLLYSFIPVRYTYVFYNNFVHFDIQKFPTEFFCKNFIGSSILLFLLYIIREESKKYSHKCITSYKKEKRNWGTKVSVVQGHKKFNNNFVYHMLGWVS